MKKQKTKGNEPGEKAETEDKVNVATSHIPVDNNGAPVNFGEEHVGICFTCTFRDSCFNVERSQGRPIWFCENFDDSVKEGEVYAGTTVYPAYAKITRGLINTNPGLKGLCVNCNNAAGCKLSYKIGGVWHCDEYL